MKEGSDMKTKWLVSVLTLFTLFMPLSPSISAQEDAASAWQELAQQNIEEINSVEVNGEVILGLESQGLISQLGRLGIDLLWNDQPIGLQFLMNITSPFLGGEPLSLEIYATEGMTYIYDSQKDEWEIEAWNVSEEEIRQELNTIIAEISNSRDFTSLTNQQENFINKYFNIQDTGALYVFSLVESIDGREFYNDFDQAFDIKSIVEDAFTQAQLTAPQIDSSLDDDISQYESELEEFLQPQYFELFFEMQPELTVTYEKETVRLREVVFNLRIDSSLLAEEMTTEAAANMPEIITIASHFYLDNYGSSFDIIVPPEARSLPPNVENE